MCYHAITDRARPERKAKGVKSMMNMYETIRARRRALGMTQEQLADRLGVSAAAVSKWELAASYPDVTLLPALARALGVDLNMLMGFERAPDRAALNDMMLRVSDAAKAQGCEAAYALAEGFVREYPVCGALLFGLAATLEGRMMTADMTAEARESLSARLRDWYLRAAESDDDEAREAAANMLALRYLADNRIDEAKAMMERLPREPSTARWPLEVSLLLAQGEKEQAAACVQKRLFAHVSDVRQLLLRLLQMELDAGEFDRAQVIADLTTDFVKLLYMHPYTGHLAQFQTALARREPERCITHLCAMFDALDAPWSPGTCPLYDRTDVHASTLAGRDFLRAIVRQLEQDESCAFLRENEAFHALTKTYLA